MFKIFISANALADTILRESGRKNISNQSKWYKILLKQSKICTIGYDESDMNPISDSNVIRIFAINNPTICLFQDDEYISQIPHHPEVVTDNPSALFYLDIPPKIAREIQNKYGVMCQSTHRKFNTKPLTTETNLCDFKKYSKLDAVKEWSRIFSICSNIPSNSLCIIDRNLFSYDWYWKQENIDKKELLDGIKNVLCILENALPIKLSTDYHVTIICDQPSQDKLTIAEKLEKLSGYLFEVVKCLKRSYNIILEIIAFKKGSKFYNEVTHNRQIVSNYYHIEALNGLNLINFNPKGSFAQYAQPVKTYMLYSTGLNSNNSDCPIRTNERLISDYQEFIKYWRKNIATIDDSYWYVSNDSRKNFSNFVNKLFV